VPDAVALVRNAAVATEAQDQVESAVWRRIERWVGRGRAYSLSLTGMQVPRRTERACARHKSMAPTRCRPCARCRPSTCAKADRDVLHAGRATVAGNICHLRPTSPLTDGLSQAAHKMARFPPQPDVLAAVRLTRTAYAQLRGQRFHPPKTFGRWSEREGSDPWRFRDVGMKIVCDIGSARGGRG
jgi:hypothetical protein